MNYDEVAKILRRRVKRAGNARRWCELNGVPTSRVSEFLSGKRRPSTGLLDALGLEWQIGRKPRGQ